MDSTTAALVFDTASQDADFADMEPFVNSLLIDDSGGAVPMQANPMALARETDLSGRAREELYAATASARETRTSTIEKPQMAVL